MSESEAPASFERQLADSWSPAQWCDLGVLVAVSGGPDSVALLRALAAIKRRAGGPGRLIVGHFNHHLQPQADQDAGFVAGLANDLHLAVAIGEAEVGKLAGAQGDGIESAARSARYLFLQEAAERLGARYLVTAHTADDQAETVLFNILRGTGLSGMAGIPRTRQLGTAVTLIRPLLTTRRCEVISYLDEIKQDFCVDPTNSSAEYTRNRIRNELLPIMRRDFNSEIDAALGRLAQLAGDAQRVIEQLADDLLEQCQGAEAATARSDSCVLNTLPLAGADRHLVREVFLALWRRFDWPLQRMGFAQWDELAVLATADARSGSAKVHTTLPVKKDFPGRVTVEQLENAIRLTRRND